MAQDRSVCSLFRLSELFVMLLHFLPTSPAEDLTNLKLVNILYRHGDRSPTEEFPTDKYKDHWTDGLGQLTVEGKQQQFALGMYFRNRYGHLLNSTYNRNDITVRSTDVDRTLMSAYCNLAGLYPPEGVQEWNPDIKWQPIPVHTIPVSQDYLISSDSVCAKYDKLLQKLKDGSEYKAVEQSNKELYDFLTNVTGMPVQDMFKASDLYDILDIQRFHNLTLPDWADNVTVAKMKRCRFQDYDWSFKLPEMRKLRGGPLLGEILKNMKSTIAGSQPAKKMFMYSAHDMTVAAFLNALDLYNGIFPPYFVTVMVELYDVNGTYSVKILYRNDTKHQPYELTLKNCTSPCPLPDFERLTSSMVPDDIVKECSASMFGDNIALISAVAGSVLGCTLLMLIVSAYAFYKKNSDNYRYFNISTDNV